jgi:hypothetical protein
MSSLQTSADHCRQLRNVIGLTSDSRLVVFRSEDCLRFGGCVASLLPWLVDFASNLAAKILGLETIGVHIGVDCSMACDRFTARCVFRSAAFGSHGATSFAHVRCPAADSAWRASSSPAAGAPKKIRARRSWPILDMAGVAPSCEYGYSSVRLLGSDGRYALRLACARGI